METFSKSEPVVITFYDTFQSWDYRSSNDSHRLRMDLFELLPYRADLLGVGKAMLADERLHGGFIGVHFRCFVSSHP